MSQKIIITGASGHIGYHVAKQLLHLEYNILLIVRTKNQNITDLKARGATTFTANLADATSYKNLFDNDTVLFHLASENTTDTNDEKRVIENTFELTKTVIDTANERKVKTIIYTSSVVVLGRSPDKNKLLDENSKALFLESPYVKGKFLAEEYCDKIIKSNAIDLRRLYPSWVVGNNDFKVTPPQQFIKNFVAKGQKVYFDGGISIASVDEVAKAHVNAWLKGKPNEKYVLAGDNITFKQFYDLLSKHSGQKQTNIYVPKWIIYLASIAAKTILGKKNPVDPSYVKAVIGNYSWYNSTKAINELDYQPPKADAILKEAVVEAQKRILSLYNLKFKNSPNLERIKYESSDILLITGFPGWLGNRMVDVFMNGDTFGKNAVDRKVRLLVQPRYKNHISLPENFEIVYGDITDIDTLKKALVDVKAVYHLAGVIYPKNMKLFNDVNYLGTKNLVDACIENKVRRIIFMGTDSICGYGRKQKVFDALTPAKPYKNYGKSKFLAEKYILDKSKEGLIDGTSLRGFWFFGPFAPERNLNFFKMFKWKKQIVFGDGKNYRSISHVDNTIRAFIKSEKRQESFGKWYWIGDKKANLTVDEIYTNIADALGTKYNPLYIPKFICELLNIGDTVLGWLGVLNPTIHAAGKFHKDIAGEVSEAEKDFDFKPEVGFEEIKNELKQLTIK